MLSVAFGLCIHACLVPTIAWGVNSHTYIIITKLLSVQGGKSTNKSVAPVHAGPQPTLRVITAGVL